MKAQRSVRRHGLAAILAAYSSGHRATLQPPGRGLKTFHNSYLTFQMPPNWDWKNA